MDIDAIIEQLAFGKSRPKLSSCLGIYISPETIYIAEVRLASGRAVVDHLVRVPIPAVAKATQPGQATATLNTEFLSDNAKIIPLIRQAMSQQRWNSKFAIVTLSHHLGLLRYFTMPAIERRYWSSAVVLEAKKYIPIPFDVLNHDYQIVPLAAGADGRARQGALVAVTPKKNMPSVAALLEGLGLELLGMEVAPCSVLRLWNSLEGQQGRDPFCQVHFDEGNIRIMISDKGIPVFFREVFLGSEASIRDARKVDLGGCVAFAQKQLGVGKISNLRVSGSAPELGSWQEAFSQEAGMPAAVHDTAGMLGIQGADWSGFAAIGAALRHLTPTALTLDIGAAGRISEGEKRTARNLFIISGAIAAFLAVGGLVRTFSANQKARALARTQADPAIEQVFAGKNAQDIEQLFAMMQRQADLLTVIEYGERVKQSLILKDIVENLTDNMWITKLRLAIPMRMELGAMPELSFSGGVTGATAAEEQDAAFQLRDRLAASPVIGQIFNDVQVSVSRSALSDEMLRGLSQAQLKRQMEQRTEFILKAGVKKK